MLWTHAFSYCNTFRHLSAMAYLLDTSVIRMQRRWMLTEWRERIGPDYQRAKEEDYFWRKRGLPRREEMKQLKDCLINLVCHLTVTDIFFTIISVWTSLYIIYTISVLEIGLSVKEEDIEKIPDPVPKPSFSSSSNLKNCSAPSVVILDLETTGLSKYFFLKYLKKKKRKKSKAIQPNTNRLLSVFASIYFQFSMALCPTSLR